MISRTAAATNAGSADSPAPKPAISRLDLISLLLMSAWCGLVAGLFEVAAIVLRKQVFDSDRFYKMSRHFVWLVPLVNLSVFLTVGLLGCTLIVVWPRHGRWLFTRVFGALLLPPSSSSFPGSTVWPGCSLRSGWPGSSFR